MAEFVLKQRKLNKAIIGRRAKEYVDANQRLKGVMKLYRDVFSIQRKFSHNIPDQLPHIVGGQVSYRLEEGRRLVEPNELEIDLTVLREMMRELGKVLKGESGQSPENMEKFLVEDLADDKVMRALAEVFLEGDYDGILTRLEGYGIDPSLLYMLLHISVAPFLWKKAAVLARKADLSQVPQGTCPVCGDLPVMGLLRDEDGLRIVECSLCGTRWGVPRMMCPFCKHTDQSKLSYIYAGGDQSRRTYLCDECRRYIKISGTGGRSTEEVVLPLEDLATVHLDHAAIERGYERGCRTVFS